MDSTPRSAGHLLRVWMADNDLTCAGFAAELDISPKYVSALRRGQFQPGRKLAHSIERVTDGQVPMSCWDADLPANE